MEHFGGISSASLMAELSGAHSSVGAAQVRPLEVVAECERAEVWRPDGCRDPMQGRLAVDLARQHHPDLILLDLHLPDLSGAEVLQLLREDPATANIPAVIVSADATRSQVERLLEAGAQDYLTKPIDVAALLGIVDRTIGLRTASVFR